LREKEIKAWIEHEPQRVPIAVRISGRFGERPVLEAIPERGVAARVSGDTPLEPARSSPLTPDVLRDKLGRLGDTPFSLASLDVDLPDGAMLPLSSLNRARRALVDALIAGRERSWATTETTHEDLTARAAPPARDPLPPGLFVLCRTLAQAEAAVEAGADGVYLDFLELTGTGAAVRALRQRGRVHITLAPPRIRKPGEEKIDRYLRALEPDALLVRGLGALYDGAGDSLPRIGDFSLNVANRLTAAEVLARGLSAFTPSFDLDAVQLVALLDSALAPFAEVVVHHPMPLFHMEHCVIAALMSEGRDYRTCGRPCERHKISLRDRALVEHPVEADVGCRNTVFHATPQSAANLVPALARSGVRRFRIELVREERDEVTRLLRTYRRLLEGQASAAEVWRALKTEGGYGVVRGSLRVLSA
jgi:putative protease